MNQCSARTSASAQYLEGKGHMFPEKQFAFFFNHILNKKARISGIFENAILCRK